MTRVGKRGVLFTFFELDGLETNVYAIIGQSQVFVVDTFLGPKSMAAVKERLKREMRRKPVVVINTHYHWDHVWGNCAFPGALIVAHARCREKIAEIGATELDAYRKLQQGSVKLVLPNCTFTDQMTFERDGIELFHSPGHSSDSISVHDRTDRVLLVGDNVEEPLPYLYSRDLTAYQRTLRSYLRCGAQRVIAGHCSTATPNIIKRNLAYVRAIVSGVSSQYKREPYAQTHAKNMRVLPLLRE